MSSQDTVAAAGQKVIAEIKSKWKKFHYEELLIFLTERIIKRNWRPARLAVRLGRSVGFDKIRFKLV